MKKLLITAILFSTINAFSQFNFLRHVALENDSNSIFLPKTTLGDVDEDGDKDIIAVGHYSVRWYENDGNGNFTNYHIIDNSGSPYAGAVFYSDIDNDGRLDIVFVGKRIWWLKNNGNGNFINKTDIVIGQTFLQDAEITDIDNDGDNDIIYLSDFYNMKVLLNDGSGLFPTTQTILDHSNGTTNFDIGDINNDGYIDIIYEEDRRRINILYNTGNGNFSPPTNILLGFRPILIDIDLDGTLDVLYNRLNGSLSNIYWAKNDGSAETQIDNERLRVNKFIKCDINSDGNMDFIAYSNSGAQSYERNTSGGNLFNKRLLNYSGRYTLNLGKLDADNNIDIIYANCEENDISAIKNNGNFIFGSPTRITPHAFRPMKYIVGENGNNEMDVITIFNTENKMSSFTNLLNGITEQVVDNKKFYDGKLFDMDGDNDNDLLVYEFFGNISIYKKDANGNFSFNYQINGNVLCLNIGDYDNDGDIDFTIKNNLNIIETYLNDGNGNYTLDFSVTESLYKIFFFDMDADGDLDLAGYSGIDSKIKWFENNNGAFSNTINELDLNLFGSSYIINLYHADFNNDGHEDFVVGCSNNYGTRIYYNDGFGNFTQSTAVTFSSIPHLTVIDMDFDGDLDFVDSFMNFYENDGAGNFTMSSLGVMEEMCTVLAIPLDYDADGDMDVLTRSKGDIIFYENLSTTSSVNNANSHGFAIYPNPTSKYIVVDGKKFESVSIFSLSGKEVFNYQVNKNKIDISKLSKGIYILKIRDRQNMNYSHQFIKN